jgi:hypothetical protein
MILKNYGASMDETEQYVPWMLLILNHINEIIDKNESKGAQLSQDLRWIDEEENNRQACSC